jgi:NAD-dependent DNA ligase
LEKLVGDREAQEALTDLEGFGETVVRAIVEGLGSRLDLLRRLVPRVDIKEAVVGDSLAGVGVQVTGKVTMGRKQLKDKVVAHGGKFSWKKELSNILVCNEPSSTAKYQEAQEKGYEILTEQEFLDRL